MNNKKTKKNTISWARVVIGSLSVLIVGIIIAIYPRESESVINNIFHWILQTFGAGYLWVALVGLIILLWLAFSCFGEIRLGSGAPEFSKFQIFCMVVCAGFGSATLYWGLIETSYYYFQPPFGIAPQSEEALEWALACNFFNWGPSAWTMFTICAVPACYSYYILKQKDLKFSTVCNSIFHGKLPHWACLIVDVLYIFISLGSVSISMGLSLPTISAVLSTTLGIPNSVYISVVLVLIIFLIFTISSFVGLDKGMSKLSDINIKACALFVLAVFIIGPKQFIIDNTTNALGIFAQNFLRMSTWTAPITQDEFPRVWTVFYMAYWMAFGPFVGVFLAKISQGHKLKDMILLSIGAGSAGSILVFGVLQNYTLHKIVTGEIDPTATLLAGKDNFYIAEILQSMPMSKILIFVYVVTCILFMATTLDSCAYSMALSSCRKLDRHNDPPVKLRLFWCVILPFMPLVLVFIHASLNTIKTIAIIATVPVGIIVVTMFYGSIKGLMHHYRKNTSEQLFSISETDDDEDEVQPDDETNVPEK